MKFESFPKNEPIAVLFVATMYTSLSFIRFVFVVRRFIFYICDIMLYHLSIHPIEVGMNVWDLYCVKLYKLCIVSISILCIIIKYVLS